MDIVLTAVEARVLGALIEKSITTPEYYPLTLNSLTAACNQKSNRDPTTSLADTAILDALDSLRAKRLAWQTAAAEARVPKYRHDVTTVVPFTPQELALICELLLRGPQTVGELRTHALRLCPLPDLAAVETALNNLATRPDGPFVVRLPRESGRREPRFAHLLCGPVSVEAAAPAAVPVTTTPAPDRMAALEAEVAALRKDVEALKLRLGEPSAESPDPGGP